MLKSQYSIRYANIQDIDSLMLFIKDHWAEKHILANNKNFFLYEFKNEDKKVNFVIAEDKQKNIQAILGFIEYGKLESNIMTVMWKSINKSHPFLGVELLNFLTEDGKFKSVSSVGINKKTEGIYKYLGYKTGKLNHYYRLANKDEYYIADVQKKILSNVDEGKKYALKKINTFKNLLELFNFEKYKANNPNPYKEPWYIEKRYYNHPVYNYQVFGIEKCEGCSINSLIICREIEVKEAKILRIVDFLGDVRDLNYISFEIEKLLEKEDYEYIDFYQYGIEDEVMNNAGFIKKIENNVIIPNYFEPYELKNVDIHFFTTNDDNILLFKADCDQDRPNYFKEE